ncbi:MAG: amidase [Alphaproteobacteria bacterium]|jgi:aspartyl-tRNA(Asn)/glutamyl-tRNA(Gln) amidotransferase subunit A|nr:amidase [Alphaproteobacteria bacterium]MDP6565984.1 amidase [Alphaproteobacteria bacterium]
MSAEDLCFRPATELAADIRARRLSPVEVTEAVLARIEALNPVLNCFCTPTPELAIEQAKAAEQAVMNGQPLGVLHGVPYSIKDLQMSKGIRTMRGSKIFEHDVPDIDTPLESRLQAAGGIFLGKTTTPEFGWKGCTDSAVTGITRNPWNTDRTPGGSSGGASAQIAAGLGPLAQGGDGGGSIRIPAAFAGIFGIKPTHGVVPYCPMPTNEGLSHLGPMTRTVSDAALMLGVIAGYDARDRFSQPLGPQDYLAGLQDGIAGAKVFWSPTLGYAKVDPEVAAATEKAAKSFTELGAEMVDGDPGLGNPSDFFLVLFQGAMAGGLSQFLPEWESQMDPGLVHMIKRGLEYSAVDYIQARIERYDFYAKVQEFFESYDLLLTPAVAVPAFEVDRIAPDPDTMDAEDVFAWTPFSFPFNATGHPAASVPCGFTADGLPIGLQIVGRLHEDRRVLQAAAAFERLAPWADKRPALQP